MSWVEWGTQQVAGQPYTPYVPPEGASGGVQPLNGGRRDGFFRDGLRRQTARPPTPASGDITSAETYAQFGLGASMLTGIPGLGVAGAALGTEQDIQRFGGRYGAPTFRDPSRLGHITSALTGGMFGQDLREQAIAQAATINPSMNPADVLSGVTPGVRTIREPGVAATGTPRTSVLTGGRVGGGPVTRGRRRERDRGRDREGRGGRQGPGGDVGRGTRGGMGPR